MVKPDIKHNYYADLELPIGSPIEDVKKAYRKLALLHHPDRNAGREEECISKFQAIQSAHEVLGEEVTKQKYDNDRSKAGLYPSFRARPPAAGNPYAATSAFPPPPRRTQPGTWQRPGAASGAPSTMPTDGANRFASFNQPRPPPQPPTAKKDAPQNRTDAFRAWQHMNTAQDRPQRSNQPNTQPFTQAPPTQAQPSRAARPPPPPPPRQERPVPTEEQIRAGMKHRQTPPVPNFNADTLNQRQSAWSAFNQAQANGANATKPGLTRSNTTKMPNKHGFNPNAPGSDERAAPGPDPHYMHRKSADFGRGRPEVKVQPPQTSNPLSPNNVGAAPATPKSPLSFNQRPNIDPTRPRSSRMASEKVPFAEGTRERTPYTSFIGEKTEFTSGGLHRSFSHRDTTKLGPDDPVNRARARSSSPPRTNDDGPKTGSQQKPFVVYDSSSEASGSDADMTKTPEDIDSSASQEIPRPGTAPFDRPKKTPTPPSKRFNGPTSPPPPMPGMPNFDAATNGGQPPMEERTRSNIFSFPYDQRPFDEPNAKSQREDNINTNFSPGEWSGKFTGESEYFAPPAGTGRKQPSPARRATPNRNGTSSRSRTFDEPTSAPREEIRQRLWGSDGTPNEMPRSAAVDDTFDKEEWEKKFQDPTSFWPSASRDASASKSSQVRKGSRSNSRKATAAKQQPSAVDAETDGAGPTNERPDSGFRVDFDDDAMDIDNTPPTQQKSAPQDSAATQTSTKDSEARVYSVPPSAWRQQAEQEHRRSHRTSSSASRRPQEASGSDGATKFNANMDDLRNVAPISTSGNTTSGFNVADLASSLPYNPRASATVSPVKPQNFQLPGLPKAPEPPQRLTKASWHTHATLFGQYLMDYHVFNNTLLEHFRVREQRVQAQIADGMGWLEASGDTVGSPSGPVGFSSYLIGIKEDEKVREAWNLGSEKHAEAVKGFDKVRERVRTLASNGTLAEG